MNMSIADRQPWATELPQRSVLIVVGSLEIGGTENHIAAVTPLLLRKGWKVSVYSLAGEGALGANLQRQNVRVISPPFAWRVLFQRRQTWLSYFRVLSAGAHLLWVAMWQRPRIIHFFLPEAYLIGGLVAKAAKLPVRVMSRRSLNVYSQGRPLLRLLECRLHRSMAAILGNSRRVVRELEEIEKVPNQRLGLIYNGIDHTKFSPSGSRAQTRESLGLSAETLALITVGNLIPYKGHSDLIDALALAAHRMPHEWRLLVVGRDHGIQRALQQKAFDYGLQERISFLGQRTDVAALLAACDIGVLCSHQEGFSNAILESMAAGLPMIVTDVGGNAEAVTNGTCGLVVPPQSPADLAEAVCRMSADAALRARFGDAARARIKDQFSLSACVAKYDRLYRTLLAGGSVRDVPGVRFADTCSPEARALA
jgi:glycosyltransferase involved in cell wall biosynthesis